MKKAFFLICLGLLSLFFLYPVFGILVHQNRESLLSVFTDPYYLRIIKFTFRQAFTSAFLSIIVGLPGAWIMKNCSFKAKKLVSSIYAIPFILPSIIVVLGFVIAYGKSGYLNRILKTNFHFLYSYKAVIAAHVFYNFPVAISVISSFWQSLDPNVENFARSTGLSRSQTFFKVTLVRLIPGIISSFTLIFLYCFTSFAIILVLGGGPKLTTLEVEIYRQARISLNTYSANALSLYSLIFSALFIFLNSHIGNHNIKEKPNLSESAFKKPTFFMYVYVISSILFIVFPVTGIIMKALTVDFVKILSQNIGCILFTVVTAFSSAFLSVLIALGICLEIRNKKHRTIWETFFSIPLATSSVLIGLGYLNVSLKFSFIPSSLAVIFAHSIVAFPFCLKIILPAFDKLPCSLSENARSLGASENYSFFHVEINAIRSEILTSYVFAFAISCGEINSTILLAGPEFTTIPVQIYRLINSYDYSGACALGLVLVLLCIAAQSFKLKFTDP